MSTTNHRTTGLIKSGAVKEVPIWYDVYRKYPPEVEPNAERPLPPQDPIPEIVYEEDFERARLSQQQYRTRRKKEPQSTQNYRRLKDITAATPMIKEITREATLEK